MDIKELDGETAPDDAPLIFDFDGKAIIKADWKSRKALNLELVQGLNAELPRLIETIKAELKNKLPADSRLEIEIEFSQGSVEWAGILAVMNKIAVLSDNINFIEFIVKAVKFAVSKTVRQRIESKNISIKKIYTNVTPVVHREPTHFVSKFLWQCAGAVPELVQSSRLDHVKYQSIGGAVLTTGVLAFFSSFYAMYSVFGNSDFRIYVSIFLGAIWALAIFNLDRYIVSSMKKEPGNSFISFLRELAPASPRFILAIIIGITISKPLELRLFQGPIDERIGINRDILIREKDASVRGIYAPRMADLNNEISQIDKSIQAKEVRARELENVFHQEMDSTGGSRKYGYSTVAKQKEESADNAKREIELLQKKRELLHSQKQSVEAEIKKRVDLFERTLQSDFFTRLKALSDLAKGSDSVRRANYFIILLLVLVEITPVLVKLFSPIGLYDMKQNMRTDVEGRETARKGEAMNEIIAYHYQRLVESERHAEDLFFEVRSDLREERLRQLSREWRGLSYDGRRPTFDELEEFVRENIFTTRKT